MLIMEWLGEQEKRTFKYEETIAKLSDKVETMTNKNNIPTSYNRYDWSNNPNLPYHINANTIDFL